MTRHTVTTYGAAQPLDFANPKPEQIDIESIAMGLCAEARFNNQYGLVGQSGNKQGIYTVAQHSVLASLLVPRPLAMYALLHDATEAYMRDISSPLKQLLPDYQAIEKKVMAAIHMHFDLDPQDDLTSQWVHYVDRRLLLTERNALFSTLSHTDSWPQARPYPSAYLSRLLTRTTPTQAHDMFMTRFVSLQNDRPYVYDPLLDANQLANKLPDDLAAPPWPQDNDPRDFVPASQARDHCAA